MQGLCPVGFWQENVVLERLTAWRMHHEGTSMARWCRPPRQIGAQKNPVQATLHGIGVEEDRVRVQEEVEADPVGRFIRASSNRSSNHTTTSEAPTSGNTTASANMITTPVFHFGKS